MNFSKYKLQQYLKEGQAIGTGTQPSIVASNTSSEAARDGGMRAKEQQAAGRTRQQNRLSAQKPMTRAESQEFNKVFREKEALKSYENQKSDWRTELQEKVVDGQERQQHPFVTVMPTGDENILQAKEQMAKTAKGKKDDVTEETLDENRRAARAAGGYKDDSKKQTDPSKDGFTGISGSIKDIMRQNKEIEAAKKKKTKSEETETLDEKRGLWDNINAKKKAGKPAAKPGDKNYPKTLNVEEVEDLEEKKKDCKDGYKWDSEKKKCVKKKKKSSSSKKSTTIIIGGRPIYGGGHHHDDDDNDSDGGDSGGDVGGGEGGGMGEMLDLLGDMLLEEKKQMSVADQMRVSREAFAKRAKKPPATRAQQRGKEVAQMVKNDTRTKNEKESQGRYK